MLSHQTEEEYEKKNHHLDNIIMMKLLSRRRSVHQEKMKSIMNEGYSSHSSYSSSSIIGNNNISSSRRSGSGGNKDDLDTNLWSSAMLANQAHLGLMSNKRKKCHQTYFKTKFTTMLNFWESQNLHLFNLRKFDACASFRQNFFQNHTKADVLSELEQFLKVYLRRPIRQNVFGMLMSNSFNLWLFLRKLQPTVVIENGVNRGQSTWLMHEAAPNATFVCIDPSPRRLAFVLQGATYYMNNSNAPNGSFPFKDFADIDWNWIKDKSKAFVLFDDHQDASTRVVQAQKLGFKWAAFDDNYHLFYGDSLSVEHLCFNSAISAISSIENSQSSNFDYDIETSSTFFQFSSSSSSLREFVRKNLVPIRFASGINPTTMTRSKTDALVVKVLGRIRHIFNVPPVMYHPFHHYNNETFFRLWFDFSPAMTCSIATASFLPPIVTNFRVFKKLLLHRFCFEDLLLSDNMILVELFQP